MFLFTLTLGVLFLPEADTLKCHECLSSNPEICAWKTAECPSQNYLCSAVTTEIAVKGGAMVPIVNFKGCLTPERCVENSINYGTHRVLKNSVCCNGDLCNTQIPDYNPTPNGKKCFTCEGKNCMETLKCEGNESYCFTSARVKYEGKYVTMKGCASKLFCSDQAAFRVIWFNAGQISCCQGDYCNSTSSVTSTLLLLLVPLLFSALFL